MPLNLNNPITTTLDKVRVEQFTVSPQTNTVMIQYSVGYTDANGQYVAKEYAVASFDEVNFSEPLYEQVKAALYELLASRLNA